jgi:hypothetical protein
MSLQIGQHGWRLYFAPEAKVEHMHRSDLNALRRVWYTYAMAHPALIDKHSCRKFELIFQFIGRYPRTPLFRVPFFIKGYIYIGSFHMMHVSAAAFIIGLAASIANPGNNGLVIFTFAMAFFALWSAYRFFYWCFFMKPGKCFFEWARMRYLTNLSFVAGGLKGFKKYKVLCVEPSF